MTQYAAMTTEIDEIIARAGETHVLAAREDPILLESLRDPRVLARATALLSSKSKVERRTALLCIERIGYVLRDQQTAALLLAVASESKDRYEVDSALIALGHASPPAPLAAAPLIRLTRVPRHTNAAIAILHLAPHDEVEPVLAELAVGADRFVGIAVARALAKLTSPSSLDILLALLDHESPDVIGTVLRSVELRLGAGVLAHARRMVGGPRWVQYVAIGHVVTYGDVTDLPAVVARLKKLPKAKQQYEPTEVSVLVPFLLRFADDPRSLQALASLRDAIAELPANERLWLERHTPAILER